VDQAAQNLNSLGGLGTTLGIEARELGKERVILTMPVTPQHHQPFGYLHGGASVALAETVASIGGFLNCPPGKVAFGLEINANHLRPKRDGTLTAIGTPLHRGQSTQVWEIKIYDEAEKLISVSRCTLAIVAADA
jgi:uncharacterized protein (TIGR00369 family)